MFMNISLNKIDVKIVDHFGREQIFIKCDYVCNYDKIIIIHINKSSFTIFKKNYMTIEFKKGNKGEWIRI